MSQKQKKHHEEEEEASEAWLLPYSDLMTLLLAVFIVLFAVSQVDSTKLETMARAFQNIAFSGGSGVLEPGGENPVPLYPEGQDNSTDNTPTPSPTATPVPENDNDANQNFGQQDLENLKELQGKLTSYFKKSNIQSDVTSYIDERGLVVSLNNAMLFDSGSAKIKRKNKECLIQIGTIINQLENYIRIEGHTDNQPISTSIYPSNWELSSARASQVVRLLAKSAGVPPEKMAAVAYGEYKPVASNKTAQGRAKNRRIDLIILNQHYNSLEDQITDVKKVR